MMIIGCYVIPSYIIFSLHFCLLRGILALYQWYVSITPSFHVFLIFFAVILLNLWIKIKGPQSN